jgi:hypothetical protein
MITMIFTMPFLPVKKSNVLSNIELKREVVSVTGNDLFILTVIICGGIVRRGQDNT